MPRKRTTTSPGTATVTNRRRTTAARKKSNNKLANVFVPMFFMFTILFCLGFLVMMGYRSATASSFFDLQAVAVRGIVRTPSSDIERIVKANSSTTGVWHADLEAIKREVDELKFVKRASISRVLPNKFSVYVSERIPRALARIDEKDYWVDEDGLVLDTLGAAENRPPFVMLGWDTRKTTTALEKNKERVALFTQLKNEWQEFDLASRVKAIDLSDMREPRAIVTDSGEAVTIYLGRENFRDGLQKGLENIAGRGKEVEAIIVSGARTVIEYRNS